MVCPSRLADAVVSALVGAHPYEEPAFDLYEVRSNLGFVGRVGTLGEAMSFEEFVATCDQALGGGGMRASGRGQVTRVAVVPGSGSDFIAAAVASGADVLVTGDVSHHALVSALDRGLGVVDPGHAPTERPGMAALVAALAAPGVDIVDHTGIDPTPWR